MNVRQISYLLLLSCLCSSPTVLRGNDADANEGRLKPKVVAALESISKGKCPEALLSPLLSDQVELQLDKMQALFTSLGPIEGTSFKGIELLPSGVSAEVYRVRFARGQMTWAAASGPDGKLNVLWSSGQAY